MRLRSDDVLSLATCRQRRGESHWLERVADKILFAASFALLRVVDVVVPVMQADEAKQRLL